jgi:preprotein translocase subunit SecA
LNAKNHEKEAEIIAQAGRWGAVTVATNMAGRGVDIILGGNPPDEEESRKVKEAGGLFVLGTERHEARRIDDQLRGRCGRQGDPGESQFFVSLEDSLLRIFGGEKVQAMMERFNLPDDEPIRIGYITKIIQSAQKRVEGHHFDARKQIMQYDDVLFKHRKKFYELRNEVLERAEVKDEDSEKNLRSYILEVLERQEKDKKEYLEKEKEIGREEMRKVERFVCLRTMDFLWKDHLTMMDELREAVRLRAYGQKEPLVEYKREGHIAFKNMMENIESMIADRITKIKKAEKIRNSSRIIIRKNIDPTKEKLKNFSEVKRNDPCPCGATHPDGTPVKFKKCHGK